MRATKQRRCSLSLFSMDVLYITTFIVYSILTRRCLVSNPKTRLLAKAIQAANRSHTAVQLPLCDATIELT